jgi:hypothetical protein
MKTIARIIAAFAAAALGVTVLAFPAQAATPSHAKHRALAYSLTALTFGQMSYSDQDNLCTGWNTGMEQMFYDELIPNMSGLGMSYSDKKYGIHRAMDEAC